MQQPVLVSFFALVLRRAVGGGVFKELVIIALYHAVVELANLVCAATVKEFKTLVRGDDIYLPAVEL